MLINRLFKKNLDVLHIFLMFIINTSEILPLLINSKLLKSFIKKPSEIHIMQIISPLELDIESTSINSFSTEDSGISTFESFSKHLSKLENTKAIEKFTILFKRSKHMTKKQYI